MVWGLMDFSFMRSNRIQKAQYMKNDEIGMILGELNKYVDQFVIAEATLDHAGNDKKLNFDMKKFIKQT